jgi:hypothetical protein
MTDREIRRIVNLFELILRQFADVADPVLRNKFVMDKIRRMLGVQNDKADNG